MLRISKGPAMADRTQRNDPFSTVNMANCCSSVDQFPQRAGKDASLVNPDLHEWVRWQCTFPERWAKCGDDTANTTRDLTGIIVGAHDDCCSINVGEMIDRQLRELGRRQCRGYHRHQPSSPCPFRFDPTAVRYTQHQARGFKRSKTVPQVLESGILRCNDIGALDEHVGTRLI